MAGKLDEDRAIILMEGEVETYDNFVRGEVYSFRVFEQEVCSMGHTHEEQVEYCGGYYSEEDAEDEAKSLVRYYENSNDHKDAVEQDSNRYENSII
jgi:hypothetical protein